MGKLLDRYVKADLVKLKGTWYYLNNRTKTIGQKKEAQATLTKLIAEGKVESLDAVKQASESPPEVTPPSMNMPEVEEDGPKPELLPVEKPEKKINPALENKKELPENLQEYFEPLAADLGDIEHRKKGKRYGVFIFGVDSRLNDHPTIKACCYVFRHCDKKNNVSSGASTKNSGWVVTSKKLLKINPRTNERWLTVARDDTPEEDFFTVANTVLCHADKGQYERRQGKRVMEDIIRTAQMADSRQEKAEQMAKLSKTAPKQSMEGYLASNEAEQAIAKQHLEENKKFTSTEAQEYIDNMNSLGNKERDIKEDINKVRQLADSGQIGKTVKNVKPLTLNNI